MANLDDFIGSTDGLVAGDHFNVERTIMNLSTGRTLDVAWMTVKDHPSDVEADALFQKRVTIVDASTEGHVTDDGSTGTDAKALFRLQPSDTARLHERPRTFDVQFKLDNGTISTSFKGTILAEAQVTGATT